MNISIKKLYVGLPEVALIVDLSESTIQKMVAKEEFPASRLLTGRRVGWLVREIEEWAETRPVSNLLPPPNTDNRKGFRKVNSEQASLNS